MALASDSVKVLEILCRHTRRSGDDGDAPSVDANALAEQAGLAAERLAAAVEALAERGYASADRAKASPPYAFATVALTPSGRAAHQAAHRDRESADGWPSADTGFEPEAPKLIRNLAWLARYGRRHWALVSLAALVVVFGFALARGLLPLGTGWGFGENVSADKRRSLAEGLRALTESPERYQVALISLDKGLEYLDITGATSDEGNARIEFRYRGETTLDLNRLDYERNLASGSYLIELPILGMNRVNVTLAFNENGTADGHWSSGGLSDRFDIVVKTP